MSVTLNPAGAYAADPAPRGHQVEPVDLTGEATKGIGRGTDTSARLRGRMLR